RRESSIIPRELRDIDTRKGSPAEATRHKKSGLRRGIAASQPHPAGGLGEGTETGFHFPTSRSGSPNVSSLARSSGPRKTSAEKQVSPRASIGGIAPKAGRRGARRQHDVHAVDPAVPRHQERPGGRILLHTEWGDHRPFLEG